MGENMGKRLSSFNIDVKDDDKDNDDDDDYVCPERNVV